MTIDIEALRALYPKLTSAERDLVQGDIHALCDEVERLLVALAKQESIGYDAVTLVEALRGGDASQIAEAERAYAEAGIRFCQEAGVSLDRETYNALVAGSGKMQAERDAALARVAELESHFGKCSGCGGLGRKAYGSTATWMRGAGGQTVTPGLCDQCWGSGDEAEPFADLRRLHTALKAALEAAKGE